MDASRRGFLKLAGVTVVSAAGGGALVVRPSSAEGPAYGEAEVPQAGTKRLAMVVDLRKFTKNDELVTRCIKACRQAHNVPDFGDDRKNAVKWIWAESFETAFVSQEFHYLRADLEGKQTLLLCNHCTNPPCVRVCPTQATFKRSSDGIVMMDWHRCIGCRYCVVACPYGSRSFNWTDPRPHIADVNPDFPTRMRGVVEKCTFCDERIRSGQQPACVEACTNDELIFGDINDPESKVRQVLGEHMAIRRKPDLGTRPEVYYIIDDPRTLMEVAPAAVVSEEDDHA